jgi:P pilus assembly chaperone PapD
VERLVRARLWVVVALLLWLFSQTTAAGPGVGVTLGSIQIDDLLDRGAGYDLPQVGVINTGDTPSDYEVVIGYVDGRAELKPPDDWFSFQPQRFQLTPGQVQNVRISLDLPTGAEPGDYFALIEAHPIPEAEGVRIQAAAASTLTFTIEPSSGLEALLRRINRYLDDAQPWSVFVPLAAIAGLGVFTALRSFRLTIQRR